MTYGIGADVVEVARAAALLARYGERFAARVLAPSEWAAFRASACPQAYLAARFAAKEAFAKALGTGLRHPVLLSRVGVANDALGKPGLRLEPEIERLLEQRGIRAGRRTPHERSLACAFVVLECA